jgi:hypothetical protein
MRLHRVTMRLYRVTMRLYRLTMRLYRPAKINPPLFNLALSNTKLAKDVCSTTG